MPRAKAQLFSFYSLPVLVAMLADRGLDLPTLARERGLRQPDPQSPLVTAPVETLEAFLAEVAKLVGEPSLGWKLGERSPKGAYGALEFCCRTRPDLEGFFLALSRFFRIINSLMHCDFERHGGQGRFRQWTPGRTGLGPHLNEFTFAIILAKAADACGGELPFQRVVFAHEAATSPYVVEKLGGKVAFGQEKNGIDFAEAALSTALRPCDPELRAYFEGQCEAALSTVATPLAHKVVSTFQAELGGELKLEAIARKLGQAPRALQYALKREDTSFDQLLDDFRSQMARRLIKGGRSVVDVAYLLGYSDARAFDRAFLRWAGMTPTEWRSA